MAIFATNMSNRMSAVIKSLYDPSSGYEFEAGVMNDAAGTLKMGTVLGKVTATGKYKVSLAAASDGSQVPAAVYVADVSGNPTDITLAANTDTKVLILTRGPAIVADAALVLGTGITLSAVKTAFAALNPPIFVELAV